MAWWKKLLRIASVVVPEVTTNKKVTVGTQVITSAFNEASPEEAAATLITTAIERGSEEPKIRAIALRLHDVISHVFHDDPDFN